MLSSIAMKDDGHKAVVRGAAEVRSFEILSLTQQIQFTKSTLTE
jgi:hypothetical protein